MDEGESENSLPTGYPPANPPARWIEQEKLTKPIKCPLASGTTPNLRRMGLDEHSCASDTAQLIIAISVRGSKLKSSQVIEL